jgi:hypothetical protein
VPARATFNAIRGGALARSDAAAVAASAPDAAATTVTTATVKYLIHPLLQRLALRDVQTVAPAM